MTKRYLPMLIRFHGFKSISFNLALMIIKTQRYSVVLQRQGKWPADGFAILTSPMTFLSLYISRWWCQTWDTCLSGGQPIRNKSHLSLRYDWALLLSHKKWGQIKGIIQNPSNFGSIYTRSSLLRILKYFHIWFFHIMRSIRLCVRW